MTKAYTIMDNIFYMTKTYLLFGFRTIASRFKNLASSNLIAQSRTSFSQLALTHCCILFFHEDTASSVRILVKDRVRASL